MGEGEDMMDASLDRSLDETHVSASLRVRASPLRSKFFRDVRRAFQMCAAQLVALLFLAVLYCNYSLIEDYSSPFLWAFIVRSVE